MELPLIPARAVDAHKGNFGKILVVGGSRGMPGAAALAGWAALKTGAGLVKVATPLSSVTAVASHCPSYTLLPCPETEAGSLSLDAVEVILKEAENADILAIGPGISTEKETRDAVLEIIRDTYLPLVVDADGLNIAAQDLETVTRRSSLCVMTPHPGEFARLDGKKPAPDEEGRLKAAKRLAGNTKSIVLLKGMGTVVTDGEAHMVMHTGNPGMATAGSGDVLTGMIAALLAVMPHALEGVALAAHLHGLAGDMAAEAVGEISVTANDILDFLPEAIQQHQLSGAS
jgi:hydroxyethylthiazole kinase-like uncharacterized protein yjeF